MSDHPQKWDEFAEPLTQTYNVHVHHATGTCSFDVVLFQPLSEVILYDNIDAPETTTESSVVNSQDRSDLSQHPETANGASRNTLDKTEARYKRAFDKGLGVALYWPTVEDRFSCIRTTL